MHYTTAGHSGITFNNCYFHDIYGIQYPGSTINGVTYTFSSGICFAGSFNNNGPLVSDITVQNCSSNVGAAELFLVSAVDSITGYCVKNVNLSGCNCQSGVFGYWLHCVDGGSATNMVATNNGAQAFPYGPCAVGIERSRNFTFTNCEFSYCQRQGSNPDGCGLDFEGGDNNVSVQNCTFKYNAGVGVFFYTKTGGSSNCTVNGCTFTNDGANPNNVYGYEVYVVYGTQTGHKITNNVYTLRSGWSFTNAGSGFTLTNNNPAGATKYEAENAALSGGAEVNTNHTGYSGTGFVDGYNMVTGASTKFTVNVSSAGSKTVDLRYSAGFMTCTNIDLYVNGTKIKTITCPKTSNWDTWSDETETLSLNNGSNTIEYRSNSNQTNNCINLDYITVSN